MAYLRGVVVLIAANLLPGCADSGPVFFLFENQFGEPIHLDSINVQKELALNVDLGTQSVSGKVDVSGALTNTWRSEDCKDLYISCGTTKTSGVLCYQYTPYSNAVTKECLNIDFCLAAFGTDSAGKTMNVTCEQNNPFKVTIYPDGSIG